MAIEKLSEFAKDGQKNTDHLNLTDGFPVSKKPARQWFNWLFNTLTSKVNEIIDADFIPKTDIVNNLTTDDAKKPVSAKQAKVLQDNKLGKTENAATATKPATARTIEISGAVTGTATSFDGSANVAITTTSLDATKLSGTVPAARLPAASTSAAGAVKLNDTLISTSTTEAATANTVKLLNDRFTNDFLNLKSENGYQKLPSGLIIQWGRFTPTMATTVGSPQYVSYPIAFPNKLLFAVPSANGGATSGTELAHIDTSLSTKTQLGIYTNYNNSDCWYFAVGY